MRYHRTQYGTGVVLMGMLLVLASSVPGWAVTMQPSRGDSAIITAGEFHTCALRPTGAVECWGTNSRGEADDQAGPYTAVSAGLVHTCALTVAGAADCWGAAGVGDDQVGPYSAIQAGSYHTCALTLTGAADCWGDNTDEQATDQAGPYGAFVPPTGPLPTTPATALPLPSATPATPTSTPIATPGRAVRVFVPQVLGRGVRIRCQADDRYRDAHTEMVKRAWLPGGHRRRTSLLSPPLSPRIG